MPALAHEGNPKENEIIITGGSVLSTAQLDIDFQFVGSNPTIPSATQPAEFLITPSGSLNCDTSSYTVDLTADGYPPFTWSATEGQIVSTATYTAQLRIHSAVSIASNCRISIHGSNHAYYQLTAYLNRGHGIQPITGVSDCNDVTHQCWAERYNCIDQNLGTVFSEVSESLCIFRDKNLNDPNAAGYDADIDYSGCSLFPAWGVACQKNNVDGVADSPNCTIALCEQANTIWHTADYTGGNSCVDAGGSSNAFRSIAAEVISNKPSMLFCDVRVPEVIAANCSPCGIVQNTDIIVTATDLTNNQSILVVSVS
jgi:hypothetical protein